MLLGPIRHELLGGDWPNPEAHNAQLFQYSAAARAIAENRGFPFVDLDFLRVDVTQTVVAPVPIELVNQDNAPGTLGGAGVVTQGLYEVLLEARPGDMPSSIVVDCIALVSLDVAIHASDLDLGAGVTIAGDPDERVAWIQPPRVSEADEAGEEEEAIAVTAEDATQTDESAQG